MKYFICDTILRSYTGRETEVNIPSNITTIGARAFEYNDAIQIVFIPESVSLIRADAFNHCKNLKMLVFEGSGVENIGEYAFKGCTNISDLTLPNSIKFIGKCAFADCNFTHIEIPKSTSFAVDAFPAGCVVKRVEAT